MKEISFLIGLKNNLKYTKQFYENIRAVYPDNEIVFVSYGSTDGTHQWLDGLQDDNLIYYHSEESKTLSDTYNKAIQLATKSYVAFLHNDMVLGKNFLDVLKKKIDTENLYCYSLIEPPIFGEDERDWKIVKDFGWDFDTFDFKSFYDFENQLSIQRSEMVETNQVSFFLCINREILLRIGGLDPLFSPMFCEDDDLIHRINLLGIKTYLIKDALAYHFVSQTSRFSEEYRNNTKIIEEKSQRNFVRKWGFFNFSKSKAKYDIGIILKNPNEDAVRLIEPLATVLYSDFDFKDYINEEQQNTKISLKDRLKSLKDIRPHDVMVSVDGNHLREESKKVLNNLSDTISELDDRHQRWNYPFLKRIFYKIFKPYKVQIQLKQPKRLENILIYKDI